MPPSEQGKLDLRLHVAVDSAVLQLHGGRDPVRFLIAVLLHVQGEIGSVIALVKEHPRAKILSIF